MRQATSGWCSTRRVQCRGCDWGLPHGYRSVQGRARNPDSCRAAEREPEISQCQSVRQVSIQAFMYAPMRAPENDPAS